MEVAIDVPATVYVSSEISYEALLYCPVTNKIYGNGAICSFDEEFFNLIIRFGLKDECWARISCSDLGSRDGWHIDFDALEKIENKELGKQLRRAIDDMPAHIRN